MAKGHHAKYQEAMKYQEKKEESLDYDKDTFKYIEKKK